MADNDRALVAQLRRIATWDVFAGLPADVRTPNRAADAFEAALDREERLQKALARIEALRELDPEDDTLCAIDFGGTRKLFRCDNQCEISAAVDGYNSALDRVRVALAGPGQKGDSDAG